MDDDAIAARRAALELAVRSHGQTVMITGPDGPVPQRPEADAVLDAAERYRQFLEGDT